MSTKELPPFPCKTTSPPNPLHCCCQNPYPRGYKARSSGVKSPTTPLHITYLFQCHHLNGTEFTETGRDLLQGKPGQHQCSPCRSRDRRSSTDCRELRLFRAQDSRPKETRVKCPLVRKLTGSSRSVPFLQSRLHHSY